MSRKCFGSVMFSIVLFGVVTSADAVTWQQQYEGDVLPGAFSPAFVLQAGGGNNGTTTLNAGGWVDVRNTTSTYYQWDMNSPNWSVGPSGSTIEIRMAVPEITGTYGTTFQVTDDNLDKVWFFGWTHNNIFMDGGNQGQPTFDVTQFNTYRFTFAADGTANVYLNNDPTPRLTSSGNTLSGLTNFSFGDLGAVGAGTGSYDYIYWTTAGAFAPVPEPAGIFLMVIGMSALAMRKIRQVK